MERISMERAREIIRLHAAGNSRRCIARIIGVSRPVVSEYLAAFTISGMSVENALACSDGELITTLFGERETTARYHILARRFERMSEELTRTGVTLNLLWEEYRREHPDGFAYTQFCHHYSQWRDKSEISMHLEHKAGEKIFVDFAGDTMQYFNGLGGDVKQAQVFVGILPASGYTYVEAFADQTRASWIAGTQNAFLFFGGSTKAIVPDNAKAVVDMPDRYEPAINDAYQSLASHYGAVVLPARVGHARDKALVENAVLLTYRRIYAKLRDRVFYSLADLNRAIWDALKEHNDTLMQKIKISRRQRFVSCEQATLIALPAEMYQLKESCKGYAAYNYHMWFKPDEHYYSVPFQYRKREVKVIYSAKTIEIYHENQRIATHTRSDLSGGYTTNPAHMPDYQRNMLEWNPERYLSWAASIGENTKAYIAGILSRRGHPEQAYNSCFGVLSFAKKYDPQRLEKACRKALSMSSFSSTTIKRILKNGLESIDEPELFTTLPDHCNIRGAQYYGGIANEQCSNT